MNKEEDKVESTKIYNLNNILSKFNEENDKFIMLQDLQREINQIKIAYKIDHEGTPPLDLGCRRPWSALSYVRQRQTGSSSSSMGMWSPESLVQNYTFIQFQAYKGVISHHLLPCF